MRLVTSFLFVLLLCTSGAFAASGTLVKVNNNVLVTGADITLGDLFSGLSAEMAAKTVEPSPALGEKKAISRHMIDKLTGQYNLVLDTPVTQSFIFIERASNVVSEDEMTKSIAKAFAEQGMGDNVAVKLNRSNKNLLVPADAAYELNVNKLDYNKQSGSFSAEMRAGDKSMLVTGRVAALVKVPVLAVQRNGGETIQESDIAWVDMEEAFIGNRAITNASDIIGKKAERLISPQTIIREHMVAAPILVRKNTLVTIVYQTNALTITSQVKALEDGALGKAIRVSNAQTNRIMDAVVTGIDQVQVGMAPRKNTVAMQ